MNTPGRQINVTAAEGARNLSQGFKGLTDFWNNPSLETFGDIDVDSLAPIDQEYVRKLMNLSIVDTDILKRVLITRTKLTNNIKITNQEADEIIKTLSAKYFGSNLDLSFYKFDTLKMDNVEIVGDLDMSNTVIKGSNNQEGMKVGGSNNQNEMKVGGHNNQKGMKVKGNSWQYGMKVGGFSNQRGMKVEGNSSQIGMKVEGDSVQNGMKVGLNSFQEEMEVKGFSDQRGMEVGLSSDQQGMKVGLNSDQQGMKVGLSSDQQGMKVKGKWRKTDGTIVIHQ